jgi:hypothetical protein
VAHLKPLFFQNVQIFFRLDFLFGLTVGANRSGQDVDDLELKSDGLGLARFVGWVYDERSIGLDLGTFRTLRDVSFRNERASPPMVSDSAILSVELG